MINNSDLDNIIENITKNIVKYLTDEGIPKSNLYMAFLAYLTYSGNLIKDNPLNIETIKIMYINKYIELYQ